MDDTSTEITKPPLGVGKIISQTFSIFFGNFIKVAILGFVGAAFTLIIQLLPVLVWGAGAAAGAEFDSSVGLVLVVISAIATQMIGVGLASALIILLAYDAILGQSNTIGSYFRSALPAIVPIAVLSLLVGILSALGVFAAIIGAFWVYAVFYATAPIAVIERGGFSSMRRSAALTKEYRWPIVGLTIVIWIIAIVLGLLAGFVGTVFPVISSGSVNPLITGIGSALITGLSYGFGGIAAALVYARLREIKDGVNVDQIAAVFE